MTQGGPLDSTSTLVLMAVRTGFQQQQTGYASAISLVFFVLVLAVSLVQRYLTRDKDVKMSTAPPPARTDAPRPRRRDRRPEHHGAGSDRTGPAARRLIVRILLVPRLRPAAALHVRVPLQAGPADLRRPRQRSRRSCPVGDISLDNYTGVFDRVPFWQFMMNSVVITVLTVVLGIIVNCMARSPWPGSSSAGSGDRARRSSWPP